MKRLELAEHFVELNFMPQDACRWLSPSELRTFAAQTLSHDLRQLRRQARAAEGLRQQPHRDAAGRPAAARGCGLLVRLHRRYRRRLRGDVHGGRAAGAGVSSAVEGLDAPIPRGQMLVLGGDQVYPTASSKAYEDRTVGPYRSAMPEATPAAADAGAARQPRLVRRPHGVPAPVHPGPDDRRLAHRAEAQLLHRPAAAPLVAGRARQPAGHLLRRPAAEVLRGDADRQPPARRQRDRLLRDAGVGQGVVGAPRRVQRAGVVRAQLRQPPDGSRAPTSSSRPAPRPGCGSAATSTTTSATRSASRTRPHPRAPRGRW